MTGKLEKLAKMIFGRNAIKIQKTEEMLCITDYEKFLVIEKCDEPFDTTKFSIFDDPKVQFEEFLEKDQEKEILLIDFGINAELGYSTFPLHVIQDAARVNIEHLPNPEALKWGTKQQISNFITIDRLIVKDNYVVFKGWFSYYPMRLYIALYKIPLGSVKINDSKEVISC